MIWQWQFDICQHGMWLSSTCHVLMNGCCLASSLMGRCVMDKLTQDKTTDGEGGGATRYRNELNGFRPDRSCMDHVFTVDNTLCIRKCLGLETFCALVDVEKAFDYVDHDYLVHKLYNKGMDGRIYNAVNAIYCWPSSCVLVNDRLTDWLEVKSGVTEGDSLSPILFAIIIDDLAQVIKDTGLGLEIGQDRLGLLMYAGDIVILGESLHQTQTLLDILSRWCFRWGMKANIRKSQVVHHRNHQRPISSKK